LDLDLETRQWGLWVEPDATNIKTLWNLCLGETEPVEGQIAWFENPRPLAKNIWAYCAFRQTLGAVNGTGTLIARLTLLENLAIYYQHVLGYASLAAEEAAWPWLEMLNLTEWSGAFGGSLPPNKLSLALLALNLAKEPKIFFLDRPRAVFNQDFKLVWSILWALKETKGLSALIFDRHEKSWSEEILAGDLVVLST
jgi:ABC-type multidrug transport system ATPase subunit